LNDRAAGGATHLGSGLRAGLELVAGDLDERL
jgi:hypothetical protein